MTPKVTVLLAVHDGEPYVRRAVESVLGQTFDDFELLVVDDASTDGTAATIAGFGDDRIRVLRNEKNLGQVPSLNRGLREARGEYVARIDHDDWCRPARLERQVAVLDDEPAVGLVGSWIDAVDERDRPVGRLRARLDDFAAFVYATLIMRVYVTHPAAMYRREPVLALGGYDEATGPAEDKDLWRRLLLAGWDARIVPEPLVVYRLHAGQLSQTRADYQREVDGRSQDRFLAELGPGARLEPVRLALAADGALWSERRDGRELVRGVEALLSGARTRLSLDDAQAGRLERLVAARLLEVARQRPWRADAAPLARWGLERVPARTLPRVAAAHVAAFAVAPLRLGVRRAAAAAELPGLRRSRLARRVYARLAGHA